MVKETNEMYVENLKSIGIKEITQSIDSQSAFSVLFQNLLYAQSTAVQFSHLTNKYKNS